MSSGTRSTRTQTETTGCRCQALARAPDPHSDRQGWRPAKPRITAPTNGDTRSAYAATVRSMRIVAPRFPWMPSSSKFRDRHRAVFTIASWAVLNGLDRRLMPSRELPLCVSSCAAERLRRVGAGDGHPVHVRSKKEGCVAQRILLLAATLWSGQGQPGHQLRQRTAPPTGPSLRRGAPAAGYPAGRPGQDPKLVAATFG